MSSQDERPHHNARDRTFPGIYHGLYSGRSPSGFLSSPAPRRPQVSASQRHAGLLADLTRPDFSLMAQEYTWSGRDTLQAPLHSVTPPPLAPTAQQLEQVEVLDEETVPPHPTETRRGRRLGLMHFFDDSDSSKENDRPPSIESSSGIMDFNETDDDEANGDEEVDTEDPDADNDDGEDPDGADEEGNEDEDEDVQDEEPPFDPAAHGLKEISNLASFTVSSYKPGSGVKELRDDDINLFWQSDGSQPHRLNIHFIKRVEIRALRLYLDYELDESYTPTKIQITAGMGPNLTIPFTTMELNMPKGWIDIPIAGAGGGLDGNSLCCWFVRVIVLENHQNGKDTHIRGVKVYALDDSADTAEDNPLEDMVEAIDDYGDTMARMTIQDTDEDAVMKHDAEVRRRKATTRKFTPGDGGLTILDFMREPEIR